MIDIIEVGPRDGFQNVNAHIDLETKQKIIDDLVSSGVKTIQHTSFVSPKAIPQMKDSEALTAYCLQKYPDVTFFPLVPNLKGAERAIKAGLNYLTYVVSLSETHNLKNINMTQEQSFREFRKIRKRFADMKICLDLSMTFGCPFEGKYSPKRVVEFLKQYVDNGIDELNMCDTVGIGFPNEVRDIISAIREAYPSLELHIHIHDTRNMGMVNTLAAIEAGVKKVQATLGGLGGCPFAPDASGNLATEDLVVMLNGMGYETGISSDKIVEAAKHEVKRVPTGNYSSHSINI